MKLKKITVSQLFGTYTYTIPLWENEAVTILHSPNGHGKTTILKLVEAAMEGNLVYLDETPFLYLSLTFDHGTVVEVRKKQVFSSVLDQNFFQFRNLAVHGTKGQLALPFVYEIQEEDGDSTVYSVGLDRDVILALSRRMTQGRTRLDADVQSAPVSLKEIIAQEKLEDEIFETGELFIRLLRYKAACNIHMIEANRVLKSMFSGENQVSVECVRLYSEELGQMIASVKQKAGELAEKLDRTFPARVLEQILKGNGAKSFDRKEIRMQLEQLEQRRLELVQAGLLEQDAGEMMQGLQWTADQELSEDTCCFLSTYIQDNWEKLHCYTDLKKKLDILLDVINIKNGFSNKQMKIQGQKGAVFFMNNGMPIPLEKLSSGEKNDFILFYELIFKCNENSLILIDEPEISLHIAWQQEFIRQLLRICQINRMQAIVATHSPNIVDEYWNLLVDLDGEEGEEDV